MRDHDGLVDAFLAGLVVLVGIGFAIMLVGAIWQMVRG